jgi:hypothetical protein
MNIITLIIVGMHSETLNPDLTQKQIEIEKRRPERLPLKSMIYIDKYKYKF